MLDILDPRNIDHFMRVCEELRRIPESDCKYMHRKCSTAEVHVC